jgi:hypothetical protein
VRDELKHPSTRILEKILRLKQVEPDSSSGEDFRSQENRGIEKRLGNEIQANCQGIWEVGQTLETSSSNGNQVTGENVMSLSLRLRSYQPLSLRSMLFAQYFLISVCRGTG